MEEIELIGKRKPREKHFLQKDGTIIAKVYDTDIHFLKDGKYEEIDNSLVKKGDLLENKNNNFKVEFEETLNKYLMKMKKNDNYLNIRLSDCNHSKIITEESSSKLEQSILYDDVMEDISIQYKTLPNKVKETIVLKSNKYSKINFIAETNLDLSMKDNCIIATKNGEKVFELEAPYMEDSEGKVNNNIYYYLINHGDHYDIELNLDSNWLNSLDIKYPVYVDPTISSSTENLNLYDTYIYPGDTNDNRYNLGYLKAGTEKINGQDRINRTLVKFDLPTIGTGYEIVDAELSLISYAGEKENNYDHLIEAHRLTADWTESSANWNSMHDKYDGRVEVIVPTIRSEIVNDKLIGNPLSLSITGLVKKWYEDTPNYGIMIKSCDENYINDRYPMFYSKNNTIKGNPQPIFVIKYRNQNGVEDYWDYKSQSFTEGQAHVNTHTGNLTTIFNIGKTIGGIMPVALNLVYNTNDVVLNNNTFFGKGFKLSLEQTIQKIENGFQYLDDTGTVHYFYKKDSNLSTIPPENDNIYYDEDGLNLKIKDLNTILKMTDLNSTEMNFSKIEEKYYLISIKDAHGNTININLNNNNSINKVVDKYNSEITIEYNSDNIKVYSSDGSITKLNYSDNKLLSIESINGTTVFTYDSNEIITSIKDVTGLKTEYEYYEKTPYRIKKVTNYGLNNKLGSSYSIKYSLYETSIKDNNNIIESIAFNDYGNAESRNILTEENDINNAYSIEETYNNKNKLTSKVIAHKYIKNYLTNTSFELDNNFFTGEPGIEMSFDTENMNSGLRSLKVESSISNKCIEQSIPVKKGEYYTFSSFVKNYIPVELSLGYIDDNGNEIFNSELVYVSDDFEREDVTIFYEENAVSELKIRITLLESGTVYLDDVQLENSETVNSFNILENSDFKDGLTGWTCTASKGETELNSADYIEVVNVNDNTKALKVQMKHDVSTSVSRKYNIKGKEGESYTLSFWYKNEGTIPYAPYVGSNVTIFYEPYNDDFGHCILSKTLPITNGNAWQHFEYTEKSIEDFKSIEIRFFNVWSANNFQVTNISFYKNVTRGEFGYDENDNLVSFIDQSNNVNAFKYDNNNQLIKMTNTKGNDFIYEYDKNVSNRILCAISPAGISNRITYDSNGNPKRTKISKKFSKKISEGLYKIRNYGTNKYIKAELNQVILEENDCSNTVWKLVKVENGFKILYAENDIYYLSVFNNKIILDTIDKNNIFYLEKNDDGSYCIKFDENINDDLTNTRILTVDGVTINARLYNGDNDNNKFYIELVDNLFYESNAHFTEDNKYISSVTDSGLNKTSFVTDNITGLLVKSTNPKGIETTYTYNDKYQQTSITQKDLVVNYEYNNSNLLTNVKRGTNNYQIIYDDFLNIKETKLNDISLSKNEYDYTNGNLLKTNYGNGQSISLDYDSFYRLNKILKMDDIYKYFYDSNGNISKVISQKENRKLCFDKSNRLYKFKNNNFIVNYTYDSENNITHKTFRLNDKVHTQVNTFDIEEKVVSAFLDDVQITYTYDELDRNISKNINSLIDYQYKFISKGKRTTDLVKEYIINNNIYKYIYDELYNITDIYLNNILIKHYEYDDYNQLINEINYDLNYKTSYVYDISGNILKKTIKNSITDDIIKEYLYSYSNVNFEDQLTSFDGSYITYDNIGNITTYGDKILNWINGTELYSYNDTINEKNILYKYNDKGIRISKEGTDITAYYHLLNDDIIYEIRNGKSIYYLYVYEELIGFEYENNRYFYLKNIQDDIIGIINADGNKIVSYEYDSWGRLLSIKDGNNQLISEENYNHIANINPFRYRSYYYDVETKMYYLNNRYYDPQIGRFISADKMLNLEEENNTCNIYKYCGNNPVNMADEEGNSSAALVGSGFGAVTGFGFEFGALGVAAGLALGFVAVAAIGGAIAYAKKSSSKSKKSSKSSKKSNKTKKKKEPEKKTTYNVYVLYNKKDGNVKYVGRTKDTKTTEVRHNNNPYRADLKMAPVVKDISYVESRVWEQVLIEQCNTLVRNLEFPTQNQINGISPKKMDKYKVVWDQVMLLQEENLVSCSGYPQN